MATSLNGPGRGRVPRGADMPLGGGDGLGKLKGLRGPIRQAVRGVEPGAEIILYGSRARGDAGQESDWDLLILVDGPVNSDRKTAIRHRLYEVEWDSDEVLTSIIFSREDWNSPLYRAMPFHQNVDQDGISL